MSKKFWKRLAVVVAILMIVALAGFTNAFMGNPVSKMLAQNTAEEILKTKYKNKDYQIDDVVYSFKDGYYHARISSPTSIDSKFNLSINMFGKLEYDDYASITDGYNTADRLNNEYRKLTDPILEKIMLKYKGDIYYGMLEIRTKNSIDYESEDDDIPEYAMVQESLEIDKLYDIRELGKSAGHIIIYVETDDISPKNAANILKYVREEFDEAGAPFRAIDLTLRHSKTETGSVPKGELNIINFNYDDIYKDDLAEKVKKADREAKEYYAKLDKEKLEQEKEVNEK